MKKIYSVMIQVVLVVYVSLSFANQVVTLEVDKTNIEGTSSIDLYQNSDEAPFMTLDATLPRPWITTADLVSVNSKIWVYAVPVDKNGVKGSRSPDIVYTTLDGSDITIKITGN